MDWEQQQQPQRWQEEELVVMNGNCSGGGGVGVGGSNGIFIKVMTDEQMETLRKQIAAYSTICDQLVEMHKSFSSLGGGSRFGNLYCDPLMASAGQRITGRQRWTPTPMQLQILERIFDKGNGTPSKQTIKDITGELAQHGQISETNVYNWFQNRRARSKRKQQVPNTNNNNGESELETTTTELESLISSPPAPNEKRTKVGHDDDYQPHYNEDNNNNNNNMYLQNLEGMIHSTLDQSNESIREEVMMMMLKPPPSNNDAAKLPMSYYDTVLSNPRMDQLMMMGKMELSGGGGGGGGGYDPYLQTNDYDMTN